MTALSSLSQRVCRAGLWFGGALILLAAIVIGIDVLMRKFLAKSIGGADELAGYALAIGTVWGLGAALLDRAHIRIDSLYVRFPLALRVLLDLAGLLLFVGFFAMVAWHGWGVMEQSWTSGSRSQSAIETPTVIPQALWMLGLGLFLASGFLLFVDSLLRVLRGDLQGAVRLVGTRSAEEEVEDEIRDLKARAAREGHTMIGVTLAILIGLLALAVPVAAGLGILGLILSEIYSRLPLSLAMGEMAWATSNNFLLVAVPFFVLLGEILLRSGMAERMYNALVLWMPWLPGGLMHSNIAACAMFAATSGSSVATAATIGTVAMGEIKKHGYSERLFLGTIAAGGTLGILIPPSINMIVYGVLTETSIPKLYLAGILPGLVLAGLFSLTVLLFCLWRPAWGGKKTVATWEQRRAALPDLIPPLVIFLAVIGSIYAGWATATESAALGVLAALGVAAWHRRLTVPMLLQAFEGTMRTTAMIMAILIAAYFLNFVITSIGLTTQVNRFITSLGLSPTQLLVVVVVFYIVLGMFMETLSMMVATVPIIAPIMFQAGYDPIWFGILVILLMETAMITPPVGINLYVVQGLRSRGKIDDVIIGTLPFVVTMMLMMVVISAFPDLVLMLPRAAAN